MLCVFEMVWVGKPLTSESPAKQGAGLSLLMIPRALWHDLSPEVPPGLQRSSLLDVLCLYFGIYFGFGGGILDFKVYFIVRNCFKV